MLKNKWDAVSRFVAVCLLCCSAANVVPAASMTDDAPLHVQQNIWMENLEEGASSYYGREKVGSIKPKVIDDDFLLANQKFLEEVLQGAINRNQADLVAVLANLYIRLPDYDRLLYGRAQALLAKLKDMPSEAVARYRALHADNPSDERVLLDLAAAEFDDFRLKESAAHFGKAAALDLPEQVSANVSRYRAGIARLAGWRWSGGISPVYNGNANNAAPQYCMERRGQRVCSITEPARAVGVGYEVGIEKLTVLRENHYLQFRADLSGTSYFFDRKSAYDDAFGRAYLGWQRKDGKQTVSVLPFYQAQLAGSSEFDGKKENNRHAVPYMLAHGVGIQASYTVRFGRDMQFYSSLERYRRYHRENARAERNDGWQDSLYVSLARRFGNSATVFGGWQFARFVPERGIVRGTVNNAAYNRNSVNVGWVRQWQELGGLNSRIAVSYARRNYKGMAAFATEAQRNREWNVSLGLSHDRLSYKGIVPTLTYSFGKTSSNMRYAERRNSQILFGADWRF